RHVIQNIALPQVQLGLHRQNPDGTWRKDWLAEPVQDGDKPVWARHPVYDVAVLPVAVPPDVAAQAIPASWFADDTTFERQDVQPGDTMEALGFPQGFASDPRGFPILRVGHLAS